VGRKRWSGVVGRERRRKAAKREGEKEGQKKEIFVQISEESSM
jgi:hypothetical protein